jgi:hypothetical protein
MGSTSTLDQKFRILAELRRQCRDVTKDVVHNSKNTSHKQEFDKLRLEIEDEIGSDGFNSRFKPYLDKIEEDEKKLKGEEVRARVKTLPKWFSKVPYAVVRQNAVGHGGFHTGTLAIEYHRLHWIYDCGSWKRQGRLIECIDKFVARIASDRVDLLFISHFDADHVGGLRRLLENIRARVDTVVVPYLGSDDIFVVLAGALANNRCPRDFVDQVVDPVAWFHQFGVRRVIRLRPPSAPDGLDGGGAPADPDAGGPPSLPGKGKDGTQGLVPVFVRPDGKWLGNGKSVVAEAGTVAGVLTDQGWADWWFVPFVHPVSIRTKRRLRRVAKTVVRGSPGGHTFKKRLLKLLRSQKGRRQLKQIYLEQELGDANAVTLSLYEGPRPEIHEARISLGTDSKPKSEAVGWLLTGDAKLQHYDRRSKWLSFFRPSRSAVGTLMLPHHGSAHNFHPTILAAGNEDTRLFITADENDETRPYREVRDGVGRGILKVSESPPTALIELSGPKDFSRRHLPDLTSLLQG